MQNDVSIAEIESALSHVIDPDFQQDLVSLKMIEDITVEGDLISFTIVLTTPACPLKEKLKSDAVNAIHTHIGDSWKVNVAFSARVTSVRNPDINILPNVKNIICVASGKGGVGKSTVSVNLAKSLARQGSKVGLIDADIHGPSIPIMLGLKGEKPTVREIKGKQYMVPLEKDGIKVLSIGLLVDERQAVVWRGPMVASALRQFITDCTWGKLDYLILDMPPGTGDVHLTMVQTVPITGAVVVTTPQQVATADATKAIAMFRMEKINVPIIGIIENMAYFTPPELPDKKYYLFGKDGGKEMAGSYEIPFLGELPLVEEVGRSADQGTPIEEMGEGAKMITQRFDEIAQQAARQITIRNADLAPTKVVQVLS